MPKVLPALLVHKVSKAAQVLLVRSDQWAQRGLPDAMVPPERLVAMVATEPRVRKVIKEQAELQVPEVSPELRETVEPRARRARLEPWVLRELKAK